MELTVSNTMTQLPVVAAIKIFTTAASYSFLRKLSPKFDLYYFIASCKNANS
jgi:hypothetical protein